MNFVNWLLAPLIITLLATPLTLIVAIRCKIYDSPSNKLKIHEKPVPYLGGVAIFLGIVFPIFLDGSDALSYREVITVSGLLGILIVGLVDDILEMRASTKLSLQIGMAFFLALSMDPPIALTSESIFRLCFSVCVIVLVCNSVNLLDGLDGLASGICAISGCCLSILFFLNLDNFGMMMSLSLAGACFAFLVYNFNPARIFMGDAGSMVLGSLLGVLVVRYSNEGGDLFKVAAGLVVCGVPIFDTSLAYVRRYLNCRPIFQGDRSHFYDQLRDKGLSVRTTVLVCWVVGCCFGVAGIVSTLCGKLVSIIIFVALLTGLGYAVVKMRMLRIDTL